jgi:hypothetical protein
MPSFVGLVVAILLSQAAPPAATGRIVGRVTLEGANTPIVGARVQLMSTARPSGPMGMPPPTTTDQEGVFVFDRLAPGEYRLNVQKAGFASLLDSPGTRPFTIQVVAGQSAEGVSIQLQKGGVIAGKLLDPSGEPLTEARVIAMRRTLAPVAGAAPRFIPAPSQGQQQTNDLGEFRIAGLAAGEYYVAAMRSGVQLGGPATAAASNGARTVLTTTYYPGTIDAAGAQSIVVAAGAEVGNLVFTMLSAPAYRVSGFVVDEDGTPVARAMVILMSDPRTGNFAGPAGNGQTEEDGRFAFGDVPAGNYRITATIPITLANAGINGSVAGGTITTFSSGGIRGEQPSEIVVTDADVRGVRVVIRRPPQ